MRSMTGFGRSTFKVGDSSFRVELRSVNSRFLDVKVRIPWNDVQIESQAVSLARASVSRGGVELPVSADSSEGAASKFMLYTALARDVGAAIHQLADEIGCDLAIASRLLPPVKELLTSLHAPSKHTWSALRDGLAAAFDSLTEMRAKEGSALKADLALHLDQIVETRSAIEALVAAEPSQLNERLNARVSQLAGSHELSAARLAQEAALLAERCDVAEELARLGSHIDQLREMFENSEPVGRRIEFMLQELNRELNTIASKTTIAEVAALVVGAKSELEKMREQAQNVE